MSLVFVVFFFFLMIRRPPRSTRTDTSFPTRRSSDLPGGMRLKRLKKIGYIIEAPTLRALAERIGCDPEGLERTIEKNNDYAKTGVDIDFGKGGNAFDQSIGDQTHTPTPCQIGSASCRERVCKYG